MSKSDEQKTDDFINHPEMDAVRKRTPEETAWSVWLAALAIAGAVTLAWAPAGIVRTHPFTALAWLLTFALAGVVADALWNARPWRGWSAAVLLVTASLPSLGKVADSIINGDTHSEFLELTRIVRLVMMSSLLVLSFRLERMQGERPVRRPVSSR